MIASRPMDLPRAAAIRLLELALHRSPRELWVLLSPEGRILPLETVPSQGRGHVLTDESLLLLGRAESRPSHRRPWLLAHSHPKGRALLSARDRLLMVASDRPAWPFPILVAGLRPQPVLARYEWRDAVGDFVLVARHAIQDGLGPKLSRPGPGIRPA